MKTRLLGAFVLIALAVIFVPMFFSSSPPSSGGEQTVSLDIPPAPDRDLQTKTMSLTPPAPGQGANAPQPAASAAASSDRLPTVNIASNRPRDVETDPAAAAQQAATPPAQPQPVIPAQAPRSAASEQAAKAQSKPAASEPAAKQPPAVGAPEDTAGTAARGSYTLNLSAYASAASAQSLVQRVRALGYPVAGRAINQAGRQLTLVTAGPFATRAAAEAARLKITQAVHGVPVRLESGASDQRGDAAPAPSAANAAAPAAAKPASRAGGFAVQVAAMGSEADAHALRDRLRGGGFDGFVDTVNVGGKRLWRVRAGPQTQRADAERLRDQIKAKLGLSGNIVTVP
ncbi:SPOR domain-containing protein [Frateuria defendens]|uniref:SPOR domain-containing protein n=1 Tax=Frateuria defendens TaxID=2219559 RepID=UPI00066FD309|nr:SPOR domain-containing protein [Frateuria defendens]